MASGNPLFNEKAYQQALQNRTEGVMTLQGTINKTFFLLLLCAVSGMLSYHHYQTVAPHIGIVSFLAFIIGAIAVFKKNAAPMLAPLYAIGQGAVLGIVSAAYNAQYQGIVGQAIAITLLVFFVMLFIYKTGIIKVTRGFMIALSTAMIAIVLFYIISAIMMLFGAASYFTSTSPLSIIINVIICGVAAFNFLVDFQFIEDQTSHFAVPKYMEWYAGFSLLVTLLWLYVEVLRLLGRVNSRN